MEKRDFDRKYVMEDILEGDGSNIRVNEPYKQHRWFTEYLLIFESEGSLWQTLYHVGHGENGETPFEYKDVIDCVRVWEKPITSVEYITEDPACVMEFQDN